MKEQQEEPEKQPCVVSTGTDRERAMLDALVTVLKTFTMADHAHVRVVPVADLPESERRWHRNARWALVLDGWVRRYSDAELSMGTLGKVRLAAEFFEKAWRLRDDQERAAQAAAEAAQLEEFAAKRVIRLRRPGDSLACYVYRKGPHLGCLRHRATVFKDDAAARAFGDSVITAARDLVAGWYPDDPWDDFFAVVPADEVPGSWRPEFWRTP